MNIQQVLEESRKRLDEKLAAHGYTPMSEAEKQAFILERQQAEREQAARLLHPTGGPSLERLRRMGLRPDELSLDWGAIKPGVSDGAKAVGLVRAALERGHGLLFLWGAYGQAKTLIGKILVAQAFKAGKRAAYANFMDALDDIRRAYDEQEYKTTELLHRMDWWTGLDVLFLDEFDKSNDTPWALERKFQIVDRCYTRAIREEALTVIASNRGGDELDGYIRSRLRDQRVGPVIHLNGPDARQSMPKGYKY